MCGFSLYRPGYVYVVKKGRYFIDWTWWRGEESNDEQESNLMLERREESPASVSLACGGLARGAAL